jgi:hypothetical protein
LERIERKRKKQYKNEKLIYLLLLLLSTAVFTTKQVVTSIDTTKNKIGAEFKLSIKLR